MKKIAFLFAFLIVINVQAHATDDGHKRKIVIQFVASDSLSQFSLIGNIKNLKDAFPKAKIEVVFHGGGILMLVSDKTKYTKELQDYVTNKEVALVACQNTMRARKITKEMLLPFVGTVPSGVAEIVIKQDKGWAYLKGGQ